jgi:putative NADH-flavin reductase
MILRFTKPSRDRYAFEGFIVLVRSPHKLGEFANRVEVVEGDYFDKTKIAEAIKGTDIVISAIGPSTK